MKLFHILTIIISIVVFLGLFIYTCVIYYSDTPTIFPKDMTACPDFWTVNPDGTCQIPLPIEGVSSLNIGKLSDSQHTQYPMYTYAQQDTIDISGKNLDALLEVSNISFLPSYNDPGNFLQRTRYGTNFPIGNVRGPSVKSGEVSKEMVYRYDVSNNIPYGYTMQNTGAIDFKDKGWSTYGDPYCAIQSWAKQNDIAWDGMMAYNKC
jgi:hypothetical protein